VMVYRCLYGQAPCYLADHLIPASDAAPRRGRLTICQPKPPHCASLSTQHVRLSGVRLCRPDSLQELAAWWT